MGDSEHVDITAQPRKGWFEKGKDGKPKYKSYRSACKSGYRGPRQEAHHILPQTSIEEAIKKMTAEKQKYIQDVKWITDWNINNPDNMIGLPHYHAYDLYYQVRETLEKGQDITAAEANLVDWFNSYKQSWRKRWLKLIQVVSPEKYPVHNPPNWGHPEYSEKVADDLEKQVWSQLDAVRKDHKADATTVQGQLVALQGKFRTHLTTRGAGTSKEKWDKRHDQTDDEWYVPFTMFECENPLFR